LRRYSIFLSDASHQILRHLHPDTKSSIRKALEGLSKDPYGGKPLKEELTGLWSYPVSYHRVIYQIEKNTITVVFIGPRRDVYEKLREILTKS